MVECGFGVSVGQFGGSRGIKLCKTSIGDGWVGLYWVFGGLNLLSLGGNRCDLGEGGILQIGNYS